MTDVLIELDTRRRVSLGKIGHHDRYLAHEEPDGTLILEPAVVMTQAERDYYANPEIVRSVEDSRARPELNRPRRRRTPSDTGPATQGA